MAHLKLCTPGWALTCCLAGLVWGGPPPAFGHGQVPHVNPKLVSAAAPYLRSVRDYQVPDVALTDADGRSIRLRDLLASTDPVMVNFVFTTCSTICPITTKVLSDVPALLGRDANRLRLVSISIDPENDTPLQLKAYAKSFHAGERWKFLTGRAPDIKSVQIAFGTFDSDKMAHEPVTLIRQSLGKPWIRIDGFATPDDLVREYRKDAAR